jgi:transposase-like protein
MNKGTKNSEVSPAETAGTQARDAIDDVLRQGARAMLAEAVQSEVDAYIEKYGNLRDCEGHRLVVRNGYQPERTLLTGLGPIAVRQPRIDGRKVREREDIPVYSSALLPRYARRAPSIDTVVPAMYLKGISTSDFPSTLAALLGDRVKNLSASTVTRLKAVWEEEYSVWLKRDLSGKRYVYFWVDGIYFNIRLDEDRACILVIVGVTEDGTKELVALHDGIRESKASWKEILLDLKARGLPAGPLLAIGDGSMGFWAALEEVYPATRQQRCWLHKMVNILDKAPKSVQPAIKRALFDIYMAPSKEEAAKAYRRFIEVYADRYPKAVECLTKDEDQLFTFYDFPKEHWISIRTTNPIESTFATVRHRARRTKGCGSRMATLTMAWKLVMEAGKTWHALHGYRQLPLVIKGIRFVNGEQQLAA